MKWLADFIDEMMVIENRPVTEEDSSGMIKTVGWVFLGALILLLIIIGLIFGLKYLGSIASTFTK